jgi:hypothetical protein
MNDFEQSSKTLSRRDFISKAGTSGLALGAGLMLGHTEPVDAAEVSLASAVGHANVPAGWVNAFQPAASAPLYPPRQAPRPGEKVHV